MQIISINCSKYVYSNHAISQMFKREISADEVEEGIKNGETIKNYLNDKPYPSSLILCFVKQRPIHIMLSQDISTGVCFIITAYFPDPLLWNSEYKNKK